MKVRASKGEVWVTLGVRFGAVEAERLRDALLASTAASDVIIDFGAVREFEDVAVAPLARVLHGLTHATVRLRGLTLHQARLLRYLGFDAFRPATGEQAVTARA